MGQVHLSVPSSPGLERSEHSSLSALVTEDSLSRSVGSRARDSRNSSDGSSSSPGLSRVLLAGFAEDSMGLSSVLVHVGVHELNDIISDGRLEHSRKGDAVDDFVFAVLGVNTHDGSRGCHLRYENSLFYLFINDKYSSH